MIDFAKSAINVRLCPSGQLISNRFALSNASEFEAALGVDCRARGPFKGEPDEAGVATRRDKEVVLEASVGEVKL